MKTTNSNLEADNLVLFPSAKNFKSEFCDPEQLEAPVLDLYNEIIQQLDDDLTSTKDYLGPDTNYESLEAFMSRHNRQDGLTSEDRLIATINKNIEEIKETKMRLKFYLDDLEMFLPSRR